MKETFLHRLQQSIARAKRQKTLSALLLVGLKEGADMEQTLGSFAPLTRCEDTVSPLPNHRIGAILEDLSHLSDPHRVAQRLRESNPDWIEGVGIVMGLDSYESSQDVHAEALKTLSKTSPADPYCYSSEEIGKEAAVRLKLEAELAEAVEHGKLVTHYQPIFNLRHGTITGFEALVRWDHPEHGMMLPGQFLDIAAVRGHLLKIDEFVLKEALTQIPIWNEGAERPIYVCVNLASDHFLKSDNLQSLITMLNTHPYSLNLLRVDVSEQVLMDKGGIESLNTLDMLSIGFNLDDFGVDSESFHCLGSFPFNSLKIDRTLIHQMEDEVNAELIVAVLRIAKRMGMKTIAEGVVTHAQLEELRNLGCTEAQGFLFSEAVGVEEATGLISTEYRW